VTIDIQESCNNNPDLDLVQWWPERGFRTVPMPVEYTTDTGETKKVRVEPDRFFMVGRVGTEFIGRLPMEMDFTTHSNPTFQDRKVLRGLAFLRSDAYLNRFGKNAGRWIVVTKSERRMRELLKSTEKAAGSRDAKVFYYTTLEQITPETVLTGPIWTQAGTRNKRALFDERMD